MLQDDVSLLIFDKNSEVYINSFFGVLGWLLVVVLSASLLSPLKTMNKLHCHCHCHCPHLGRVIRDLFRLLHDVLHGTDSLLYSNYPIISGHSLRTDC